MRRQLRVLDEQVACDVCGRTMLKGEQTEAYLAPSRERKLVCSLCAPRAQQEGWIRESASPATPAQPPREPERRRRFRRGRRGARDTAAPTRPELGEPGSNGDLAEAPAWDGEEAAAAPRPPSRRPRLRRDPRHVRAVPTNAQLKIERAIELFNGSDHPRTVAGIARTLGEPQVSASTAGGASAEVLITVAWDISWYQFVVDLSDTNDSVRMEHKGSELDELTEEARAWNALARADGSLKIGAAAEGLDDEEPQQGL
jgi:hypothetical protein